MSCTLIRRDNTKRRKIRLFTPAGAVDFVTIDMLGPLPETESGHKYVVVITNGYSKLTKAIKTTRTTATKIVNIFKEHGVLNLGILSTVLMDNGPNFPANSLPHSPRDHLFKR